ncbi:MAG: helix-turn-helix domain-containing protein, partial [Methanobacteriota archaeon]
MRPPSLFFGLVLLALLAPTALGDFATSRDGVEVQVSPDEHLPAHTPRTVEVDTTPTRLSRPGEAVVKVPAGSAPGAKTALAEGRLLIDGPGSTAVRKGAGAADYVFRGAESAVENRCHMFGHDGGPCRRRDRVQYDTGGSPTRPESPGTATASVWDFAERVADASIREVVVAWPGLPAEARAETSLPEAPGVRRSIELPFLSPLYLAADLPGGVAGAARDVPMPRSGAVSGGPSLPALPRATLVALAAARGVAAAEVAPQLPARVPHEVAGFPLSSGALATAGTGVVADTSFGATVRVLVVVGTGLLLVLVPLLRRILTRSDAEHAARARILTHLSAEPGLSVSEVAARSGLAVSTAAYHLDVLERVGAVV